MGGVLRPFARMRRPRHAVGYPGLDAQPVLFDDVAKELPKAEAIIDLAGPVHDEMSPF